MSKTRPSVVFAFDVLPSHERPTPENVRLRKLMTIIDEVLVDKDDLPKNLEREVVMTGRRVMSITPVQENGTLLFWELMDAAHLQTQLAAEGILIRGALTLGEVRTRPGLAAGSGLLTAERLLEEVASVPRVVVDPRLLLAAETNPLLRASHHTSEEDMEFCRRALRQDMDGVWFVDYLATLCHEAGSAAATFLEAHRSMIEINLGESPTLDGRSRMWTWLRCYHNKVVREVFTKREHNALRVPSRSALIYTFPTVESEKG